ncbi:MAG: lysophospholipid acyltransferase family protein [Phyllobacteriaceae bacterium]|nr:lysophospholipid acyltransferase family protein [Phyllobacteriaceae bacterium]
MELTLRKRPAQFPELTYANENQPRLKRWFIRSVETLSGRERYARLYSVWRNEIAPTRDRVFARMLDLIDVRLDHVGQWPPANLPDGPLVIVANHPFGIGDGIAILALVEQLGRPFKVMINADLLKIREMGPYSLPVDFSESKEALKSNLAVRHEALRLLKDGTVIVVFPAGGVATAPKGFGQALDLPWKIFPARLVLEAKAHVIPMHFDGQNGRLFHIASRVSMTVRLSLLIHEFTRLSGKAIRARIGTVITAAEMAEFADRKAVLAFLHARVFALAPKPEKLAKRLFRNRRPAIT